MHTKQENLNQPDKPISTTSALNFRWSYFVKIYKALESWFRIEVVADCLASVGPQGQEIAV